MRATVPAKILDAHGRPIKSAEERAWDNLHESIGPRLFYGWYWFGPSLVRQSRNPDFAVTQFDHLIREGYRIDLLNGWYEKPAFSEQPHRSSVQPP